MKRACWIWPLLLSAAVYGQDLRQIELELKARYVGKALRVNQDIRARELKYDAHGEPLGQLDFCREPSVHIDAVRLTQRELILSGRGSYPAVQYERGPAFRQPPRDVVIRVQSDGQPWQLDHIVGAIGKMASPPALQQLPRSAQLPKEASPPPPGGDSKVLYLLPSGPVYRAKDGIEPPKPIQTPDPEYTEPARRQGVCGTVVSLIIVNEDGSVGNVRPATEPLGYGLDESAMATFAKWRFKPAKLNGNPVKVELEVTASFRMY